MNSNVEHCLAILKALQISEVTYCLSGGGDSGTAELHEVAYLDGRIGPLPSLTIGITDTGNTVGSRSVSRTLQPIFPTATGATTKAATAPSPFARRKTTPTCRSNAT